MWYIFSLGRKEILANATVRLYLQDIKLSEISQSQKDKYCGSLIGGTCSQIRATGDRTVISRAWGEVKKF